MAIGLGSNIKTGGGSNVRSPVYAEMGHFQAKRGKKFLSRHAPLRGEKQRTRGAR